MGKLKGKARAKRRQKQRTKGMNRYQGYLSNLLKEIRKYDDPILKEKCTDVDTSDKKKINEVVKKMKKVLGSTETGVGIAAPQIGHSLNIIAVRPDIKRRRIFCMINPEIVEWSEEKKYGHEGCLSYPRVNGIVERHVSVKMKYIDEEGEEKTDKFTELESIIVQHEVEHLSGNCQIYDWWKDPEGKKKELQEIFDKKKEEKDREAKEEVCEGAYEVVESEDLKKEKEEKSHFERVNDGVDEAISDFKEANVNGKELKFDKIKKDENFDKPECSTD
jgi:peptide deformylase